MTETGYEIQEVKQKILREAKRMVDAIGNLLMWIEEAETDAEHADLIHDDVALGYPFHLSLDDLIYEVAGWEYDLETKWDTESERME